MSPATACWPGRMWRARAPSRRSGSTRSRPGASRRSPTCRRSAPPAWPAPLWDGRCTKAALPSSRRSSARPRDGRPGAAAHDRTGRSGVAPVEPHDVELCPGSERRPAAGAARRVAQHGGARRTLARSARHGACAGTGRRCHLALRVAGARVRLFAPRGRRGPARPGARRRGRAGGALTDARPGGGKGTLVVRLGSRRLTSRVVSIPDSGILSTEVTLPPSPFPGSLPAGWQALEVRLEGVAGDSEPRDDARWLVLEVSPPPSVVLLAAPPDWDSRFLARTLSDVARVPVRTLVQSGSDGSGWRDAAGLTPVSAAAAAQAVAGARLVVRMGDPAALDRFPTKGAVLTWPTQRGQDGDWYVRAPEPSPLAGAVAWVAWDSLPPAAAVSDLALPPTGDSAAVVVLTARLARRGAARPVIVLSQPGGARRAAVAASGLFRWAFRGGASAEAYRAVVAALA